MVLLALVVLPVAVGCTGMFQAIGARWVTRQLTDEFDLNEEQQKATRASVDRLIEAAPQVLGPPLKQLVDSTDQAIAQGLSDENIIPIEREFDALANAVVARVIDEAAPILATLSDKQIAHAEGNFKERFDEARERLEEPTAERLEKRQQGFVDGVEEWSGDLTRGQKKALREYVAKLPDDSEVRIAADERRIQAIGDVVRANPGAPTIRAALWQAWEDRRNWGPGSRPPEARDADRRRTLIYIDAMFTAEQREHAREHLQRIYRRVNRFLSNAES